MQVGWKQEWTSVGKAQDVVVAKAKDSTRERVRNLRLMNPNPRAPEPIPRAHTSSPQKPEENPALLVQTMSPVSRIHRHAVLMQ